MVSKNRAKFRRWMGNLFGMEAEKGEIGTRAETVWKGRREDYMASITVTGDAASTANRHFGSARWAAGKMKGVFENGSMFFICCASLFPALENPEPLQVLERHVEERDTACHRLHSTSPTSTAPLDRLRPLCYRHPARRPLGLWSLLPPWPYTLCNSDMLCLSTRALPCKPFMCCGY